MGGTPIRDIVAEMRELGMASASFHPDGSLASTVLIEQAPATRTLVAPEVTARVETPEEQKARLDALLFASAQ